MYKRNYLIRREFRHECKEYIKYNYNNPNQKSFNSYQAKIYRQIHVIEKHCLFPIQEKALERQEYRSFCYDGPVSGTWI